VPSVLAAVAQVVALSAGDLLVVVKENTGLRLTLRTQEPDPPAAEPAPSAFKRNELLDLLRRGPARLPVKKRLNTENPLAIFHNRHTIYPKVNIETRERIMPRHGSMPVGYQQVFFFHVLHP